MDTVSTPDKMTDMVIEFHQKFDFSINRPFLDDDILQKRLAILDEEYQEFREAVADGKKPEILKELCDLLYTAIGFGVCYGLPVDAGFTRVHASNMSKTPSLVTDGKATKGAGYIPAALDDLFAVNNETTLTKDVA